MKTAFRNVVLITLLVGILKWPVPVGAQSIEPNVPVRPHEADNMNDPVRLGREPDDLATGMRTKAPAGAVISVGKLHKPTKAARKQFEQGMRDWRNGQHTAAVEHFIAALRSDPDYAEVHARIGELFLKQGESSLALVHLDQALAFYPRSEVLESNKAWALLSLKRPIEAEQAARRALDLAPNFVHAHYLLAVALLQQNRATEEAVKHLEIAADKYPELQKGLEWVRDRLASQNSGGRDRGQ
jgi:Tfp pilus assembly protein PilF